ncbi:MAG: chemotaxis protein CheD [Gammaproteobacteria bacterium]|nr:chemotaxis protein CheD [Gammaproteobacteria bacterium]
MKSHVQNNKIPTRYLVAGEVLVVRKPTIITTVLGSCIAVCLWDSRTRIGGMNHFILPRWDGRAAASNRFGDVSMRTLIRRMMSWGAQRRTMKAHVFGGATPLNLASVRLGTGPSNADVAVEALRAEGIPIVQSHTGGAVGTRLQFNTSDGSVALRDIKVSKYFGGGKGSLK